MAVTSALANLVIPRRIINVAISTSAIPNLTFARTVAFVSISKVVSDVSATLDTVRFRMTVSSAEFCEKM